MTFNHGIAARGLMSAPRSPLHEGRFGRMFRHLPAFAPDDEDLVALAATMVENPHNVPDAAEPSNVHHGLTAGFTYVAQFVDHDLTFDPASQLDRVNDPDALRDFRTPRFDLDSLYGGGPIDQVFLYHVPDRAHLLFDEDNDDLVRNREGTAVTGDPRGDENSIVTALHLAFVKYHNAVVDELGAAADFDTASRLVRFHYQWLVLNDFLPRLVGSEVIDELLVPRRDRTGAVVQWYGHLAFFRPRNRPFMPVEFAAAAYRPGHSMVRFSYALNRLSDPDDTPGAEQFPVFDAEHTPVRDLRGGIPLDDEHRVAWYRFFDFPEVTDPALRGKLQTARAIDTQVVYGLGHLPPVGAAATGPRSLPERNLRRGKALGLPTGQDVARAMGVPEHLVIGSANPDYPFAVGTGYTRRDGSPDPSVPAVAPATRARLTDLFADHTPLWYYILKEAELIRQGQQLGPVGGRIVAEVIIGLLLHDPQSYLVAEPSFQPRKGRFGAPSDGEFGIVDLLRHATGDPLDND